MNTPGILVGERPPEHPERTHRTPTQHGSHHVGGEQCFQAFIGSSTSEQCLTSTPRQHVKRRAHQAAGEAQVCGVACHVARGRATGAKAYRVPSLMPATRGSQTGAVEGRGTDTRSARQVRRAAEGGQCGCSPAPTSRRRQFRSRRKRQSAPPSGRPRTGGYGNACSAVCRMVVAAVCVWRGGARGHHRQVGVGSHADSAARPRTSHRMPA